MIRILHLITDLDRGGAERIVVELAAHHDRRAFAVSVAWLRGAGTLRGELEGLGVPTAPLAPANARGLRERIRREGIDLLHSHLIRADLLAGAFASASGGPPWVTTKHNTHYFRGLRRPYRWIDGARNRRAARVVAVSEAVRAHYIRTERLEESTIDVIPNGITPSGAVEDAAAPAIRERARALLGADKDAAVVIQVGSLMRQKGHGVALAAVARLAGEGRGVTLAVVGAGALAPVLAARSRRLGIEDRVRFLGERADVRYLLHGADLFLLPSLWEGFGLALLEAMDAGLPVVASRVGGIPEVVRDGETGLLVPAGDSDALAHAMARLLADVDGRRRMGEAGRLRTRRLFRSDIMARRYEDLYVRLLEGRTDARQGSCVP